MIAVAQQHIEAVKILLEAGGNPNIYNSMGRTPLMFASRYGNKEIVAMLLQAEANPNLRGAKIEDLPLISAAAHGHVEVTLMLLEAGADLALTGRAGKTAQQIAEEASKGEVATILRKRARSSCCT